MTEIGNPSRHKVSHQDGGRDELDLSGLAGQQIWIPYNGKIADITHADTNKHTLDLAAALSEARTIVAINGFAIRITGTGGFRVYPNEGTSYVDATGTYPWGVMLIAAGTQRLQYNQSVANDDFDLYCTGYLVEA